MAKLLLCILACIWTAPMSDKEAALDTITSILAPVTLYMDTIAAAVCMSTKSDADK